MRFRAAGPAVAAGTDSHDRMELSDEPYPAKVTKPGRRLRLVTVFVFAFIPIIG